MEFILLMATKDEQKSEWGAPIPGSIWYLPFHGENAERAATKEAKDLITSGRADRATLFIVLKDFGLDKSRKAVEVYV